MQDVVEEPHSERGGGSTTVPTKLVVYTIVPSSRIEDIYILKGIGITTRNGASVIAHTLP